MSYSSIPVTSEFLAHGRNSADVKLNNEGSERQRELPRVKRPVSPELELSTPTLKPMPFPKNLYQSYLRVVTVSAQAKTKQLFI